MSNTDLSSLPATPAEASQGASPGVPTGDLVQRLREDAAWWAKWGKGAINGRGIAEVKPDLLRAAADEIERLQGRVKWWMENAEALTAERNELMNAGGNHAEIAARMKREIAESFSSLNGADQPRPANGESL